MITLAIESSTSRGSVAISDGSKILFGETFLCERGHSTELFAVLERSLKMIPHFEQIAVGVGPGSYSGIRIAISAAIGIGLIKGAALVGLPSVLGYETDAPRYCVIGDARRDSFYFSEICGRECMAAPQLLAARELSARLADWNEPIFAPEPLALFPNAQLAYPSANQLAQLAAADRGIVARDNLEPLYLREPHITTPRISNSP